MRVVVAWEQDQFILQLCYTCIWILDIIMMIIAAVPLVYVQG